MAERPVIRRYAIYTRKSSEEGLDQAYNSLAAQRDACAAYIASQKHEGWIATKKVYDDGGFSGGNLLRPGLQELMQDMAIVEAIIDGTQPVFLTPERLKKAYPLPASWDEQRALLLA